MAAASWFSGANLPSGSETYLHAEPVQLSRQVLNLAWEDLWAKTQGVLLPEGNRFCLCQFLLVGVGKTGIDREISRVDLLSRGRSQYGQEEIEDSDDASHWGTPFCMDALF